MIAYERLTGVDGDVERVISIRQESPLLSYAVSVPQLEAEVGRWVLLDAYLIEEHVRRRDHPRQVADVDVADPANPLTVAFSFPVTLKRPTLQADEGLLRVWFA